MIEINEKDTMLEDTYGAEGIRWSSGEKTKEHQNKTKDQRSRPHEDSILIHNLWRVDINNKAYLSWRRSIAYISYWRQRNRESFDIAVSWVIMCHIILRIM